MVRNTATERADAGGLPVHARRVGDKGTPPRETWMGARQRSRARCALTGRAPVRRLTWVPRRVGVNDAGRSKCTGGARGGAQGARRGEAKVCFGDENHRAPSTAKSRASEQRDIFTSHYSPRVTPLRHRASTSMATGAATATFALTFAAAAPPPLTSRCQSVAAWRGNRDGAAAGQ